MAKEAKRLKEFLEDYDDDRDDPKYYRGSALQKRLRDREKEMEADERDRKREKEELEEIRQRLLAEGHPDPDAELQRVSYPNIHNNVLIREMQFMLHGSCCLGG